MTTSASFENKHPNKLFIGGRWVEPATDRVFRIVHPAIDKLSVEVAEAREVDIDRAVAAGRQAFDSGPWPHITLEERIAVLSRWAAAIEARQEDIAQAQSTQIGIPITMSREMAGGALASLRTMIDLARSYDFVEERPAMGCTARVVKEPVGTVAAIVPWNYPARLGMQKIAPALLSGCTVIVKSSPEAPLDLMILAECAEDIGLPEGVLSIVCADRDVGERLVRDPRIDKVSFTGSTAAGKHIASICMERCARVSLELGGKSAAIVLDDYPIEAAVPALVSRSTILNGQACMGLTRVLAPRSRHDALAVALAAAYAALKVGDPFDEATQIGPVASLAQGKRVSGYIESGKEEGARVVTGGTVEGCFVQPTVFADVRNDMRIAKEEIFGPVLIVLPYDSLDEAIAIANDSPYGLNGAVFTNDLEKARTVAARVRTGTVAQNALGPQPGMPFGGFKQSGIGREGCRETFDLYTEIKCTYLIEPSAAPASA